MVAHLVKGATRGRGAGGMDAVDHKFVAGHRCSYLTCGPWPPPSP
jgi:hypothetical protein